MWKDSKKCDVLTAHKPAVWAVASLFEFDSSRRILSGTSCGGDNIAGGCSLGDSAQLYEI